MSWTKDQLKNAPDFQYYKSPARTTSTPGLADHGHGAAAGGPSSGRSVEWRCVSRVASLTGTR